MAFHNIAILGGESSSYGCIYAIRELSLDDCQQFNSLIQISMKQSNWEFCRSVLNNEDVTRKITG